LRYIWKSGSSPGVKWSMVCDFYRSALIDSDFAAGCPVANVAQEAYDDPTLRGAAAEVFDDWRTILVDALVADGHRRNDAADLAELCIAGLEGALMLARVRRTEDPLDAVERRGADHGSAERTRDDRRR
jgi:TetR/AcrR family transcriptional repressor of lmrAB and yxaGH operons